MRNDFYEVPAGVAVFFDGKTQAVIQFSQDLLLRQPVGKPDLSLRPSIEP